MSPEHQPAFERVAAFGPLCAAAHRACKAKRRAHDTARFMFDLEREVLQLEDELLAGRYRPQPYRTFEIREPKPRTISAAAFRDRVVHHALCAELEPLFERRAVAESFACRPGKGMHAAVVHAQRLARRSRYVLKLDVRHFFETVDHEVLCRQLGRCLQDERVMALARTFVEAGAPGSPPGKGLPIGNLTSQHFANFALVPLDQMVKRQLRAPGYCRYMDDLLLFGDDKHTMWQWADAVVAFLRRRLMLELRHEVTRLMPVTQGFGFLGFQVWPHHSRLDGRRVRRFRQRMRALQHGLDLGTISDDAAQASAQSLIGWASHANTWRMRRAFFSRLAKQRAEV